MNKKGSLFDIPVILFMLVVGAISVVVLLKVFTTFTNGLAADPSIRVETRNSMTTVSNDMPGVFDFIFLMFFIGLPLATAFLAFFNNIPPILFYASLGFVIMIVLIGASFGQIWENANNNADFNTISSSLPMTNYILSHFGFYSFFVFVIVASATFIRIKGQEL